MDWNHLAGHAKGLVALSGCLSGRVCKALEENRPKDAAGPRPPDAGLRPRQRLRRDPERRSPGAGAHQPRARGARRADRPAARRDRRRPLPPARRREGARGAPLHPVRRLAQEPEPLEVRHRPVLLQEPGRDGRGLRGLPEALRATLDVAERLNVEIQLGEIRLPKYPVLEGRDAFDYLVELCEKGLQKRYGTVTPELNDRLRFELKTIKEMGFADYFLIVWDFVRFAKQNGIQVGPGRGSAAGSIAAYSLEITDVDPMRYDLLFERFLNLPQVDAGHGHRLRRRRTRPRHQLRGREVRAGPRRPDHHLRHDARPRRRPRRRSRARGPVRHRRQDREGDSGRPGRSTSTTASSPAPS